MEISLREAYRPLTTQRLGSFVEYFQKSLCSSFANYGKEVSISTYANNKPVCSRIFQPPN